MALSPVINTILLLAFTYFISSLIISAINEAISGVFRLRPKHLQEGMEKLFFDADWKKYITGDFLKSPFIESLMREKDQFPAYIPAKNFARAVLSHCSIDLGRMDAPSVVSAIDAAACLPKKMKEVVKGFVQQGDVRIEDLELSLEEFYERVMQRVTGWYTRFIRRIIFYLSLVMAISLNIDTFKIVSDGLSDKERLERAADGIAQQVAAINKDGNMRVQMGDKTVTVSTQTEPALGIDSSKSFKEVNARMKAEQRRVQNVVLTYENTTGYALGYENWAAFKHEWGIYKAGKRSFPGIDWANLLKKLIGIVITAFALQLGSNYWFGVLNKVVSIRAAGVKPEEKKDG